MGLLERHAERKGKIRACWIHESHHRYSLQIHPFAPLCKITEEEEEENSRFVFSPREGKILIRRSGKNSTRDTNF